MTDTRRMRSLCLTRMISIDSRHLIGAWAVLAFITACDVPRPPIIVEPPGRAPSVEESYRWERDYARARPKFEVIEENTEDPHHGGTFQGAEQESEESSSAFAVLADVLAFPFRAVGWLIQSVF